MFRFSVILHSLSTVCDLSSETDVSRFGPGFDAATAVSWCTPPEIKENIIRTLMMETKIGKVLVVEHPHIRVFSLITNRFSNSPGERNCNFGYIIDQQAGRDKNNIVAQRR